jgi:LysW-gamma-L-lysine carboxypeptidase
MNSAPGKDRDGVVELLREMLEIRSESGREARLARHLVARMSALGLDGHVDGAGNAVGEIGSGPRQLVLLGHMDTVSGGPAVELRDGRLYGRGAVDAKGPLAVFVTAAARWRERLPAPFRLTVIGAVEEEVSSSKGARYVAGRLRPEACVIGEPSGVDAVTLGYKGRLLAEVRRSRDTAHSAGPEPNASELLVEDWLAVRALAEDFNRGLDGIFARLQTELRTIATEPSPDEDACRGVIGFRLPPGLEPEELAQRLRHQLTDAELRFSGAEPPWVGDPRGPLTRAFRRAVREQFGTRARRKHKTGTSDMNVVGPRWRCPILAYGPGDSRLDHTPREHVVVDELVRAVDVLSAAIGHWVGEPNSLTPIPSPSHPPHPPRERGATTRPSATHHRRT